MNTSKVHINNLYIKYTFVHFDILLIHQVFGVFPLPMTISFAVKALSFRLSFSFGLLHGSDNLLAILFEVPFLSLCPFLETSGWYVSNVSIIFDCSMILYCPFWIFMGFTLHFYTIFGTNILTGGTARIAIIFCLFQCFKEKEYQTESKQNETIWRNYFWKESYRKNWSARQERNEGVKR